MNYTLYNQEQGKRIADLDPIDFERIATSLSNVLALRDVKDWAEKKDAYFECEDALLKAQEGVKQLQSWYAYALKDYQTVPAEKGPMTMDLYAFDRETKRQVVDRRCRAFNTLRSMIQDFESTFREIEYTVQHIESQILQNTPDAAVFTYESLPKKIKEAQDLWSLMLQTEEMELKGFETWQAQRSAERAALMA